MNRETSKDSSASSGGCATVLMLTFGILMTVSAARGDISVPLASFGMKEPFEPWQMWAMGIGSICISLTRVRSLVRYLLSRLVLTETMKKEDAEQ